MSATPPQPPEQIRGETLTPVSPKPLHYPSPANVPILEASMDPAFSDTVTQSLHHQQQPQPVQDQDSAHQSVSTVNPAIANNAYSCNTDRNASAENPHVSNGVSAESSAPSSLDILYDGVSNPAHGAQQITLPVAEAQPAAPLPDAAPTSTADSVHPPKPIDTPNDAERSVDYSAILANLSSVIASATPAGESSSATPAPAQSLNAVTSPSSTALPSNPNLPPKPPAQDQPHIHSSYVAGDDLRNYHPHQQENIDAGNTSASAAAATFPNAAANLPHQNSNGLPPAPSHAYQAPSSTSLPASTPAASAQSQQGQTSKTDEDGPFDTQTQQKYDQFIAFERQNVHDGQWDKFPLGSRLFIGNLSTEKVHKKDVFRKFHKYGQLAQISLKQAYGFVQFMDAATCSKALASEQGQKLCGREMHLEISKPTKNNRQDRNRRRSRSPDYGRGGRADRYPGSPRDRDNRRSRDEWRRSPSPRRYAGRTDRYDDRRRRSPSPYTPTGSQYGAPHREEIDLPWRALGQVPDIQILVVDDLDQDFIRWVDTSMKSRGVTVDVLMLNPRWPEEAVIRHKVMEGVLAIVHLTRADRARNTVSMQLFKRSGGNTSVSFDRYVDLSPYIAADLVLRAKFEQSQAAQLPPPPQQQAYPPPPQQHNAPPAQYGYQPQPLPPPPVPQQQQYSNPTDLTRIISSLPSSGSNGPPPNVDVNSIMSSLANAPPGQTPGATGLTPDVARLLGQMGHPPPLPQAPPSGAYAAPPPPQQQQAAHPAPSSYHPTPAPTPGSNASTQPAPSSGIAPPMSQTNTDIQQLLANLTNYKPPS
ncbi:hypothetical protein, variant [Verruconis gallopava]|uniref:RRM domain-containing protein n=1 Tax=Verruconis gallopava TaxID=253628 RepID=A0A0D2A7V0_9PEZI|nr:hypothetical protein, variant [Verruconis gallopava]KIW02843.1 hypothetical protein, variant [Verruconis gallopava]